MGAGCSNMVGLEGDGRARQRGLADMPESCVAAVMLRLDPPEICRLARLGRAFRAAADADFIWEAKLPSNYLYLMEVAAEEGKCSWSGMNKKEIYARLSRPIPFDGGTKEFWLEKCKGKFCMLISSKALSITGINDRRYWNYIPTEESRSEVIFERLAEVGVKRLYIKAHFSHFVENFAEDGLVLFGWKWDTFVKWWLMSHLRGNEHQNWRK